MLKRLIIFKKGPKVQRTISDSQVKDAHYLFPETSSNPVKNVFYDKKFIEARCEKTRFAVSSASERESQLTSRYFGNLSHNIHRLSTVNLPVKVTGLRRMTIPFREPKLIPFERNAHTDYDYSVFYSEELERIQNEPIQLLKSGKLSTYLPSEYKDEISIIKHLKETENSFDKTNFVGELQGNEVLVGNLPHNFNFFTFKRALLSGKESKVRIIKDMFGQPALLKIEFATEPEAKEFAENNQNVSFGKSTLKFFTNSEIQAENEAYENRTLFISGFLPTTSEAEIIATVNQFSKVIDIHYPTTLEFRRIPYSSDVRAYIDKNRASLPSNVRIVLREFNGVTSNDITVFESGVPLESQLKFFTDGKTIDDVKEYSYEKIAKLREKENNEMIRRIIREQNTIHITTLDDSLKVIVPIEPISADIEKNRVPAAIPNDFASLTQKEKDFFIETLVNQTQTKVKTDATTNSQKKILTSLTHWPVDVNPNGLGWCLITFPTTHETRKAAYGLRFESHFERLHVNLHGKKHFFEYFDSLNSKIYTKIYQRHQQRDSILKQEQSVQEAAIIDKNINDFIDGKINHTRDSEAQPVNLATGARLADYNVQKFKEQDTLNKIRAKEDLEKKLRQYMNTFVIKENFSRSENLETKLAGLEQVDEVMQRRGRQSVQINADEELHVLKKRISKSGETFELERGKQAVKFVSGLKSLLGNEGETNAKVVADVLDRLALEYGYTTKDTQTFRELLENRRPTPSLSKTNLSGLLSEELPEDLNPKKNNLGSEEARTKPNGRRQMFERLNKLASISRNFSIMQKANPNEDYLHLYQQYYATLESKFTGDYYKTREFKDYLIDNYVIKREKFSN